MSTSEIIFTQNIEKELQSFLKKKNYSRVIVLVDENTGKHCLPFLNTEATVIKISSGENYKNLTTCEYIWGELTKLELDRNAVLINLGGGVIGDMGGFCAATYKRGIEFIQIPTTLLSQVDASVGGKLGIDFLHFKNHIGVFQTPAAVIINTKFLQSLPPEELRSGFAEIIKHCLIADSMAWKSLKKKTLKEQDWSSLTRHSVAIKEKITTEDPTEKGLRKILNFGHTIGHAIESYFLDIPGKKLLHGEAIAIGMICEAFIAKNKNFISEADLNEIKDYILSVFPKVEIFDFDIDKIIPLALQDKKNAHKNILASLLDNIGKANYNIPITLKEIREAIIYYNLQHAVSNQ